MKDTLIRFLLAWSLIATCLLFMQHEAQKPLLVYHADSKYAITGKVTENRKIGNLFTITVDGNVFVVSEERYKNIEVGEEVEI
nr:MAG TPA: Protein of unknown function (DUF1372) [Caudoviricetes sp.]DAS90176.1 MAG TPA: Protein of unknown function (DUF1372) [Caudoviricetes sp.]